MAELDWEQEYLRDEAAQQKRDDAKHIIDTDCWYRMNGIVSPYTIQEIEEAEKLVKEG